MASIEEQLSVLAASLGRVVERLDTEGTLPKVLTKRRAAKELSISLSKLNRLIRDGRLLTVEIGRRRMIPSTEVEKLARPASSSSRKVRLHAISSPEEEAKAMRAAIRRR